MPFEAVGGASSEFYTRHGARGPAQIARGTPPFTQLTGHGGGGFPAF